MGSLRRSVLAALLPLLGAFAVGGLLILAVGGNPTRAYGALLEGALGSPHALSETLLRASPLLLTGLAVLVAFRCGQWNIGAEGQVLMGALAVVSVGRVLGGVPGPAAWGALLLAGALAGAAWSLVAGAMKVGRGVPEVISTIMLNFVALHLVSWAVNGPLIEAARTQPVTDPLPTSARLPGFAPPTRLHWGIVLPWAAAAATGLVMGRTLLGFRIRAVGANPEAARTAGMPVPRTILASYALSGALAGLAAAVELLGLYPHRLSQRFLSGYGYMGVAVALLGQLTALGTAGAALLFGALVSGSEAMEQTAGVSSVVISALQATVLFFLAAGGRLFGGAREVEGLPAQAAEPRKDA